MKPPGRRLLTALILVLSVVGLVRVRIDVDVLNLLPDDLPEVRGLQWHQRHFSAAQDLWITVAADDPQAVADTTSRLVAALRADPGEVRRVITGDPMSGAPAEWAPLLAWLWLNQSPEAVTALLAGLEPEAARQALDEAREVLAGSLSGAELARAATDPFGLTRLPGPVSRPATNPFQSEDGRFQVIEVQPGPELRTYPVTAAWLDGIRQRVDRTLATSGSGANGVRVQLTGGPAFTAEIATGMEQDLTRSAAGTLLVVAGLFFLAHRTWRPLVRLLLLLVAGLGLTLAAAGLVGSTLNVVSLGFAAILLGLVVDYGVITWHERQAHPGLSTAELRRRVGGPVGWSAVTTAGAFAVVAGAGLPGLRQLGTLVAFGVLAGAVLMVLGFSRSPAPAIATPTPLPSPPPPDIPAASGTRRGALVAGLLTAVGSLTVLAVHGWPGVDSSAAPLRPRESAAYAALGEWEGRVGRGAPALWLLVPGDSPDGVGRRLDNVRRRLATARDAGQVLDFRLPDSLWPRPERQQVNLGRLRRAVDRLPALAAAVDQAGFTDQALQLTRGILEAWRDWPAPAAEGEPVQPPGSDGAAWLIGQAVGHGSDGWVALGMVEPAPGADPRPLARDLAEDGAWLTSWERLGPALLDRVAHRLPWIAGGALALVLASLVLAFRSVAAVLLSMASLVLAGLLLLAGMSLAGMRWNLMSLVALPLALGLGVDYSIHVLVAARRGESRGRPFWRGVGGALLLCGGTTLTGFASLGLSGNAGLASLGWVCAAAVAAVLAVALLWLPAMAPSGPGASALPTRPSSLYRAPVWRAGLALARILPRAPLLGIGRVLAWVHRLVDPTRRRVVEANLRPLCRDDRSARRATRRLYGHFARKIVDLWRHEAGADTTPLVRPGPGWEHFRAARETGRGVLLVTPHLGNWEFGTLLLTHLGEAPLVITAREPGPGFTELREAARAGRGTRTVVVGDDPFAFVPVIRHLQDGGLAALLVDRPAPAASVTVEFLGRPFAAAISPAEMARATGCILLPVAILWEHGTYGAHVLPAIGYDRSALGDRAARTELTGRILRAFEPLLREHPDQWFHFVPVWP